MRGGYIRGAVLVLAVVVLAVEGYFGYRWYGRYYGDPTILGGTTSFAPHDAASGSEMITEPGKPPADEQRRGEVALLHRATPETIVDNSTYVDHPLANGNPDAVLLVTQVWEPDGAVNNTHPVGVWYDVNRGGRWAIFNQDLAPMPGGIVFSVVVAEQPSGDTFFHRVTPANTTGESTYLDHTSTDAAPEAVLSVTSNWNPGGGAGIYHDHPVGIWYDADLERWSIRNQDLASMTEGAAFNVSVWHGNSR